MLIDCVRDFASETELFILGNPDFFKAAKVGRDRVEQAILPIDKTISCGENLEELLRNEQCLNLITAFGVGITVPGAELDLSRLRYQKVFVVTDESEEGKHIRKEIFRFLRLYMPGLLNSGKIYVPQGALVADLSQSEFEVKVLSPATRSHRPVPLDSNFEQAFHDI